MQMHRLHHKGIGILLADEHLTRKSNDMK